MNNSKTLYPPFIYSESQIVAEYADQSGKILHISGPVGVGKTAMQRQLHLHWTGRDQDGPISHLEWRDGVSGYATVNCVGQSTDTATGYLVPSPTGEESGDRYAVPSAWPIDSVVGDAHITLCVDEVDKVSSEVLNCLLGLMDARDTGVLYLGTHKLGKNVKVYFTSNRREDGSQSSKVLSAPFITRTYSRSLVADVPSWVNGYAIPNGLDASPVVAWLASYGADWFSPPIDFRYDGRAIPCPRQWTSAARMVDINTPHDVAVRHCLAPLVGDDAANACAAYLELIHQVKPQLEALKNGGALPSDHREQYALLFAAIRTIVLEHEDTGVAVKAGDLDWFLDALAASDNEIQQWAVPLASSAGIKLSYSPKYAKLAA